MFHVLQRRAESFPGYKSDKLARPDRVKDTFYILINENYSVGLDIERYQSILEHVISKEVISIDTDIYVLPKLEFRENCIVQQ